METGPGKKGGGDGGVYWLAGKAGDGVVLGRMYATLSVQITKLVGIVPPERQWPPRKGVG